MPQRSKPFSKLSDLYAAVRVEALRRLQALFVEPITEQWRSYAREQCRQVQNLDQAARVLIRRDRSKRSLRLTLKLLRKHPISQLSSAPDTLPDGAAGSAPQLHGLGPETEPPPAMLHLLRELETGQTQGLRDAEVPPVRTFRQWVVYQFGLVTALNVEPPRAQAGEVLDEFRKAFSSMCGPVDRSIELQGHGRVTLREHPRVRIDGTRIARFPRRFCVAQPYGLEIGYAYESIDLPIVGRTLVGVHPRALTVQELAALSLYLSPGDFGCEPGDERRWTPATMLTEEAKQLRKVRSRRFASKHEADAYEKQAAKHSVIASRAHLPLLLPGVERRGRPRFDQVASARDGKRLLDHFRSVLRNSPVHGHHVTGVGSAFWKDLACHAGQGDASSRAGSLHASLSTQRARSKAPRFTVVLIRHGRR